MRRRSCTIDSLPVETLTHILKYLPVKCLRRASRVSNRFHACAWDAGLSISRTIDLDFPYTNRQLDIFREIVRYALPRNLAVRLSVSSFSGPILSAHVRDKETLYSSARAAIMSSAPVLVSLSLKLNSNNYDLTRLLSRPMPRLQELELMSTMGTQEERARLPLERFTGNAPNLRKVSLLGFLLGDEPAPAFTNVTTLYITEDILFAEDDPLLEVDVPCARLFPNLSRLEIMAGHSTDLPDELRLDLSGVVLRSLFIEDVIPLPFLKQSLDFDCIPVIRRICFDESLIWLEPEHDDSDFSLRIILDHSRPHSTEMSVVVVPSHRRWRRIYDLPDWPADSALPIAEKRGAAAHLTYLRLENTTLHFFLSCNVALPALLRIQVDVRSSSSLLWPPDAQPERDVEEHIFRPEDRSAPHFENESRYTVRCAALEMLTVFALDARATVQSLEVAFLGRALGQLGRHQDDKAALVLAGVEFALPVSHSLIEQTFSAVSRKAFSGLYSGDDYDQGMWGGIRTRAS